MNRLEQKNRQMTQSLATKRQGAALIGTSLYCFNPESIMRRRLSYLVVNPHFESAIFFMVGMSCVLIALENPLSDADSRRNHII